MSSSSSESRRNPHVVNVSELEPLQRRGGTRFGANAKRMAQATGGQAIGCNWFEVEPGRSMCPHHYHCSNEEALFILEGVGTLRLGKESVEVREGDYITCPVGPDFPHQLTNTGTGPLRYLCISTKNPVDVVGYPDSNKIAALAHVSPENPHPWVASWFPAEAGVPYFFREDIGESKS